MSSGTLEKRRPFPRGLGAGGLILGEIWDLCSTTMCSSRSLTEPEDEACVRKAHTYLCRCCPPRVLSLGRLPRNPRCTCRCTSPECCGIQIRGRTQSSCNTHQCLRRGKLSTIKNTRATVHHCRSPRDTTCDSNLSADLGKRAGDSCRAGILWRIRSGSSPRCWCTFRCVHRHP